MAQIAYCNASLAERPTFTTTTTPYAKPRSSQAYQNGQRSPSRVVRYKPRRRPPCRRVVDANTVERVRDKPSLLCEHRLVDCSGRAKRRLDRERSRLFNRVQDEALALLRYGPPHVARDRAVAAEANLGKRSLGFFRPRLNPSR